MPAGAAEVEKVLGQVAAQSGGRLRPATAEDLAAAQITVHADPHLIGLWRSGPRGEVELKDGVQALAAQALILAGLHRPAELAVRALVRVLRPPRRSPEDAVRDVGGVPHTAEPRPCGYEASYQVQDSTALRYARVLVHAEDALGLRPAGQAALGLLESLAHLADRYAGGIPGQYWPDGSPAQGRAHEPPALWPDCSAQFIQLVDDLEAAGVGVGDAAKDARAQARAWLYLTQVAPGVWPRMVDPRTLRPVFGTRSGEALFQFVPGLVYAPEQYRWWNAGESAAPLLRAMGGP